MAASPVTAHKDPALTPVPDAEDEAAWLAGLRHVRPEAAPVLLAVMRTLCPHDGLGDAVYRRALAAVDRAAGDDARALAPWHTLAAQLAADEPAPFAAVDEGARVRRLQRLEGSEAFTAVQRGTVRHLYDDLAVWQAFGYEGASHHLGGYRDRGFDDLDWLPPVPPPGEAPA